MNLERQPPAGPLRRHSTGQVNQFITGRGEESTPLPPEYPSMAGLGTRRTCAARAIDGPPPLAYTSSKHWTYQIRHGLRACLDK